MELFTIGHSNHDLETFIARLKQHGVTALADVRSHPYSRYLPHFNQPALKAGLRRAQLYYVFLGTQLGARPDDPACYEAGTAVYEKISATPAFSEGIERVLTGAKQHKIALMCAEQDPLDCHRAILVCQHLRTADLAIHHILKDGSLESHQHLEERLLIKHKLSDRLALEGKTQLSLFHSVAEAKVQRQQDIRTAYRLQGQKWPMSRKTLNNDLEKLGEMILGTPITLYTIGFTQKGAEKFFDLLTSAGVTQVIDTRLNNVSQLAGFAKKSDLAYFLKTIGNIEYSHALSLAPTKDILTDYKKNKGPWATYEKKFVDLLEQRQIAKTLSPAQLDGACLLCSEATPHFCHRRLVAEYLNEKWGNVNICHL